MRQDFEALWRELATRSHARRYILADLHDLLARLNSKEFDQAVQFRPEVTLPSFEANYVAAMIEYAARLKGTAPPDWTRAIPPLEKPWFASSLVSLRLHLLTSSPAPFRRRNLFVDSSIGARV